VEFSTVRYSKQFPLKDFSPESCLLIFDEQLLKAKAGKKIIQRFPLKYKVKAGEKLKDIKAFPKHAESILKTLNDKNTKDLKVIALGGGSVGDFAGFIASVLKRGVPLIQVPSTWLSAIDSAHGGKTGLNAGGAKNQIGTFFPAEKILIIEDLLSSQPQARLNDGAGELFKIALIEGKTLWKKVSTLQTLNQKNLWKLLPEAINAKYKVVKKDPQEKTGYRQILNLGHTLGHVIEATLRISHGDAVGQGLIFALRWSHERGLLNEKDFAEIESSFMFKEFEQKLESSLKKLNLTKSRSGLLMDKKKSQKDSLFFILLKKPGQAVRQKVSVQDVINEVMRQKAL
jgi:3-dehydroquinate synthase